MVSFVTDQPVQFAGGQTVINRGPTVVFYGPTSAVSPTSAAGSVVPGASFVLSGATWFVSAKRGAVSTVSSGTDYGPPQSAQSGSGAVPPLVGISGHSVAQGQTAWTAYQGWAWRAALGLGARHITQRAVGGSRSFQSQNGAFGDGGWAFLYRAIMNGYQLGGSPPFNQDGYLPRTCVELHQHAQNDIAELGSNFRPMLEAHRAIWGRFVASRVFENNGGAPVARTGTWTEVTTGAGANCSGNGYHQTSTVNDVLTYTVPANVPTGRVHQLGFVVLPNDDYTIQFRLNGTLVKTDVVKSSEINPVGEAGWTFPGTPHVVRFGTPADGLSIAAGAVITATLSARVAGTMKFDFAGVEADPADGPLIAYVLPYRMPAAAYAAYVSSGAFNNAAQMNDALMDAASVALAAVLAEFDGTVKRTLAIDLNGRLDLSTRHFDTFHLNNAGQAHAGDCSLDDIRSSGRITPRLCSAIAAPLSSMFFIPINGTNGTYAGGRYDNAYNYLNSWAAQDAGLDGNNRQIYPGYYRDADDIVRFRGRIVGGATDTVAFKMPWGYGRAERHTQMIATSTGTPAMVEVLPWDANTPFGSNVKITFTGTPTWFDLSSLEFLAQF